MFCCFVVIVVVIGIVIGIAVVIVVNDNVVYAVDIAVKLLGHNWLIVTDCVTE